MQLAIMRQKFFSSLQPFISLQVLGKTLNSLSVDWINSSWQDWKFSHLPPANVHVNTDKIVVSGEGVLFLKKISADLKIVGQVFRTV